MTKQPIQSTIRKFFLLAMLLILSNALIHAQQTSQKFVQELNYLLYLPDNYNDTSTRWPLMLFLHGSGESGTDLEKVKVHGPPKLIAAGQKFPMIIVSPQATNGWKADQLMALVNELKTKYRVDPERLYLTGLSMGGFGTWALATEYPGEFAAIAPICGGGDTTKAWTLRNTPVWNFHGQKDATVPIQNSIEMVDAVKRFNPNVKFTIYPEAGHDSWTETYNNPEFFTWILAQKKFHYKEDLSIIPLQKLAGSYRNNYNDTLTVQVANNKLVVVSRDGRSRPLKAARNDLYFINEWSQDDVHFVMDKKGKVEAMEIWNRRKMRYTKFK